MFDSIGRFLDVLVGPIRAARRPREVLATLTLATGNDQESILDINTTNTVNQRQSKQVLHVTSKVRQEI